MACSVNPEIVSTQRKETLGKELVVNSTFADASSRGVVLGLMEVDGRGVRGRKAHSESRGRTSEREELDQLA